jgi:hypothetical protein
MESCSAAKHLFIPASSDTARKDRAVITEGSSVASGVRDARGIACAWPGIAWTMLLLTIKLGAPFNPASPHCAALIARWVALHDAAPGLWFPELWELAAPLLAPVLLHAQREYGCHLEDQRFADLLASAPPSFKGTRFRARLHSCACRPASIWLDTSFPLTLSDSDFVSSARLRQGLPAGPANAPALRCDCGTNVLPGDSDHPLTCTCLALQRTSRHNFVTASWRCSGFVSGWRAFSSVSLCKSTTRCLFGPSWFFLSHAADSCAYHR